MAALAREVDEQIRELERAAERQLAAGGSAVRGAAAEHDLLNVAEGARDFLLRAVQGEKGTLSELFGHGHSCERWERLRDLIDRVSLSDAADRRWQGLREVIEIVESILKELGTFKGLGGPRGAWPPLARPPAEPRACSLRVPLAAEGGGGEAEAQLPLELSAEPGAITLRLHEGVSVEEATWRVTRGDGGEAKAELVFSMKETRVQPQEDNATQEASAHSLQGHCSASLAFGLQPGKEPQEADLDASAEEPLAEEVPSAGPASGAAPELAPELAAQGVAAEGLAAERGEREEEVTEDAAAPEEAYLDATAEDALAEDGFGAAPASGVAEEASADPVARGAAADAAAEFGEAAAQEVAAERAKEEVAEALGEAALQGAGAAGEDCAEAAAAPDRGLEKAAAEDLQDQDIVQGVAVPAIQNISGSDGSCSTSSPKDSAREASPDHSEDLDVSSMATIDCGRVNLKSSSHVSIEDFEWSVGMEHTERTCLNTSTLKLAAASLGVRSCAPAEVAEVPAPPPSASAPRPPQSPPAESRCLAAGWAPEGAAVFAQRPSAPQRPRAKGVEVPVELVSRAAAPPPATARPAAASFAAPALAQRPRGAATPTEPRSATLPRNPSMPAMHRSSSSVVSNFATMSTMPRHCPGAVPPVRRASAAPVIVPVVATSKAAGGTPPLRAPATPPAQYRTLGGARPAQRPAVQRMESAPSGALRGVVRRETGHWEERRVVEVRTERHWVTHSREEIAL